MLSAGSCHDKRAHGHFRDPPWTTQAQEWQRLDKRLPEDHLARRIARAVEPLDLTELVHSYWSVGKKAHRPDRLLKVVLYEMQSKRPSPAQWARDVRENEPLRWLLLGAEPSRTSLYDFRDRLAPFLEDWHAQVMQQAVQEGMTTAERASLDGSTVAADASRRRLFNEERLHKRCDVIDEHLQQAGGEATADSPYGLAESAVGLREQKQRYERACEVMQERQQQNQQQRASKRKPPEKILVSPADPEAALGRDKENVFRPCAPRAIDARFGFAAGAQL